MIGRVRRATIVGIALLLAAVNLRLYSPAPVPAGPDRIVDHLRFVDGAIDDGLAARMQRSFPEGYFFTHALYGLTWVELGLQPETDEATATEALTEARSALAALDTPAGRAPFSADLDPPYGGFYLGWTNYLRAGIVALQVMALGADPDPTELAALTAGCDEIIDALDRADSPFLTSYPGQTWPVDTYPAMVSVQACAEFVDPDYRRSVERWLDDVDREIDPVHGLVGHRTEPFREHPRATSQTMILRFLAELDPERAAAAYDRFRAGFVTSRLGLPAVREHPNGIDAGGDVDSGPLITGVSASATVVAVGAARSTATTIWPGPCAGRVRPSASRSPCRAVAATPVAYCRSVTCSWSGPRRATSGSSPTSSRSTAVRRGPGGCRSTPSRWRAGSACGRCCGPGRDSERGKGSVGLDGGARHDPMCGHGY